MSLIIATELSRIREVGDTKDLLSYPVHLPAKAAVFLIMQSLLHHSVQISTSQVPGALMGG